MKFEPIPVTPSVIKWARLRAGLSVSELAHNTRLRKIELWEDGREFPSYPQLELLADKFKVPVAVFFFPEPPDVPDTKESFRTLPEYEFNSLPSRIQLLVRKAKAFQISIEELTGGRNPSDKLITRDLTFTTKSSVSGTVKKVRKYLGVSFADQISWRRKDVALKSWREIFYNAGIFVFKDKFRQKEFSGFCLYDEEFPLIYVNNTSAKSRQIFTLFHELAHLLFHTSGIDFLNDDVIERLPENKQKIEVICNRFAAEYLVPEEEFEKVFNNLDANEIVAKELADFFSVSRELIYRKFRDRKLITEEEYKLKAAKWTKQWEDSRNSLDGGDYYNNMLAYLGKRYINLAFSQYYQNRISETQLADYLNTKPKNLNTLEGRAFKRSIS